LRIMRTDLPLRNLLKYSFRTSIGVGCLVLVAGYTLQSSFYVLLFRSITTFLLFFCSCLINMSLLRLLEKKGKTIEPEFSPRRFALGYLGTLLMMVLFHYSTILFVENGILPRNYFNDYPYYKGEYWGSIVHTLVGSFIVYVLVYFFHNFVILLFYKTRNELEISELKAANFETANQLLRQQIQPHFLFNALNVLKSLIRKYPVTAEEYLVRLSDFLRASITLSKTDTATLGQELKLCEDYMEMQKIRFGNSIRYNVHIPPDDPCRDKLLPFFSLQSLLENAIKHNQHTDDNPLVIDIRREGDRVVVVNNLQPRNLVENSTGNGLHNLRERYRILSDDEVEIRITDNSFSVSLKMLEHEYRNHRG